MRKNTLRSTIIFPVSVFLLLFSGVLLFINITEAGARRVGINNFRVEIDGVAQAGIKEIRGIESEVEVFKIAESGISAKRPGPPRYSNLVLKRGFINDPALYEWYKKILSGETDRKSGSIIVLDRAGGEAIRYNFFEAWPCRWKAPTLDTKGGDREFVEEIELCIERWEEK